MNIRTVIAVLFSVLFSSVAMAEEKRFDNHVVYFSALNSTFITAETGRQYGVRRSEKTGLLTLSVHQEPDTPIPASITVSARSLLGTMHDIDMKQVREGEAIYYIGTFPLEHRETLTFDIDIAPEDDTASYSFDFSQEFYR